MAEETLATQLASEASIGEDLSMAVSVTSSKDTGTTEQEVSRKKSLGSSIQEDIRTVSSIASAVTTDKSARRSVYYHVFVRIDVDGCGLWSIWTKQYKLHQSPGPSHIVLQAFHTTHRKCMAVNGTKIVVCIQMDVMSQYYKVKVTNTDAAKYKLILCFPR